MLASKNKFVIFIEKIVQKKLFWLIFCSFFFAYPVLRSVSRQLPPPSPVYFQIPSFNLQDENGDNFGTENLKGKVAIVHFHFLSCPTICPKMLSEMQVIQKRVRGLGQKIILLSVTVDGDRDSSKALFEKARELKANPYVWKFLTGAQESLDELVIKGFKSVLAKSESSDIYDITHSEKFFLVDGSLGVRGIYSNEKSDINKMMIDTGLLVNSKN